MTGGLEAFLPYLRHGSESPPSRRTPTQSGSDGLYNPFAWNLLQPRLFGWNFRWLVGWNALFSYLPLLLHLLQCLHSTTSILIKPRGAMEPPESLAVLEACLYRCDPQRLAPHLLSP